MFRRAQISHSLHPRDLQSAAYVAWRTQFAKLPMDDIQLRAVALGKTVVQRKDRPEAHALLVEVIPRARHLSQKGFKDLCIMANTAALHRECLQLFRARWEVRRDDSGFAPFDAVIDAAFHLHDVDELLWLARLAATSLLKYSREVTCDFALWRVVWRLACLCVSPVTSTALRHRAEAGATAVWLDHVQRVNQPLYDAVVSHTTPYDAPSAVGGDQSIDGDSHGASNKTSNSSPSGRAPAQRRPVPQLVYTVLDVDMNSTMRKGFAGIFRRMQRIALYHRAAPLSAAPSRNAGGDAGPSAGDDGTGTVTSVSSGGERADALADDGEMHFFAFCKQYGLLRFNPRSYLEPPQPGAPPVNAGNVEQYFYSMVMTCRSGLYVEQAIRYSEEYRALLAERKNLDASNAAETPVSSKDRGPELSPATAAEEPLPLIAKGHSDFSTGSNNSADDDGESGLLGNASPGVHQISESFFFQVLSVLQSARAHRLTLKLMGPIVSSTSEMSAALWSQILLAAGEEKNLSVCRQGFEYAYHSLAQRHFPRGDTVSSMEYLLQTSMHAMAKCYVPQFMDTVVAPCLDNNLISLNNETIAYLLTQNALHAPDAERAVVDVREWMRDNAVSMSTRIASLVMKILLRVESPTMIDFYREMVDAAQRHSEIASRGNTTGGGSSGPSGVVYKKIWLEELILCADRRRYFLTQGDRRYILSEIERVFGAFTIDPQTGKFSTSAMEGLRTQVAMLVHDARNDPLQTFLQWEAHQGVEADAIIDPRGSSSPLRAAGGAVVDGLAAAASAGLSPPPILSDPRCYFLTRQPHCCLRWRETPSWYTHLFPTAAKATVRDQALLPVTGLRARHEAAVHCWQAQLSAGGEAESQMGGDGDAAHDQAYRALLTSIVEQSQLEQPSASV